MTSQTPVRARAARDDDGCHILSQPAQTWVDGGEERIARILADATDLSSLSDELAQQADDWITRYHLSRERGNIVRPLAFGADARVLEIGAGCGAVTRCLGEQAELVDALEPTLSRARCAHLRTRDLPSVQVFVGALDDVPRKPAYDLVVAIGVLEYVGGADDEEERAAFLREAAARLRPGGCLVVGIENRLGVKYLAGAPEDHADRPFEGIEEYPRRGPFRTFARAELEALVSEAGLEAEIHHAFPDYKLPRLIFSDALLAGPAASLAWRAARFPSYDSPSPRPRLASELHLWRGLLHAGLGSHFANSFLLVARRAGEASRWPADQLAVFYASNRRSPFVTESRVVSSGQHIEVARQHLSAGEEPRREGSIEHHCTVTRFAPGPSLLDRLEHAEEGGLRPLLERWRDHVLADAAQSGARLNIDPLPDNIIDTADGWRTVDDEWQCEGWDGDAVLGRCLIYLALSLAALRPPEGWPDACTTLGDVVAYVADLAGAAPLLEDLDTILRREAELQAQVTRVAPADTKAWTGAVSEELERLRSVLSQPLDLMTLGLREWDIRTRQDARVAQLSVELQDFHDRLVERQAQLDEVRDTADRLRDDVAGREAAIALSERELDERQRRIAELGGELQQLRAAHEIVVSSRSWRLTEALRRVAAKARRTP
jgi:SAM-dependent methyltransferase